ncbi:MAG: hypothetical protein IKI21_02795 [Oscillospiraceae bacterium]|nr:hypothetical protein [Oscillospiraceae bacterium]
MSSITLIVIAGLAILLVIWVLVRRLTQRSPKVSRCGTRCFWASWAQASSCSSACSSKRP